MRQRAFTVVACALVLLGFGCHRVGDRSRVLTVEHEIAPQPVRVGTATITFTATDSSSRPVTGAQITVEADMSHAGMAPVFAHATEIAPGRYRSQLLLSMAGDWVILLHGTLPDGEKLEQQFDIRGVRPN